MKILITGTAGFIGYHLVNLISTTSQSEIIGLDCINNYYDVNLKYDRLKDAGIEKESIQYGKKVQSSKFTRYSFIQLKLEDKPALDALFQEEKFDTVINLAAQAGVRYSIENPYAYLDSNITGFLNILEACRHNSIKHLVYASSSSVYGLNEQMPFATNDNVDHPISLYAASKKSNELMAHTYSHLYNIPTTGLRFFTVYGPWGRPDMALFLFTKAIFEGKPIKVFNNGLMERDFTYIDDIVEGIYRVTKKIPSGNKDWSGLKPDPSCSKAPYKIYNIGNNSPVKLLDFISEIEKHTGKIGIKNMKPIQPGDVTKTWANVNDLVEDIDYRPDTSTSNGISNFIHWYRSYYSVNA